MDIREVIQAQADAWAALGHPYFGALETIILKHGVDGRPARHGFKRRAQKECFKNAAELAFQAGLRYVEGYAMRPDLGIPIAHAWNLDEDGGVIDVTWRKAEDAQYLGIIFSIQTLSRELLRNKVYGILDTGRGLNVRLLREIDAELVEKFRKPG